MKITINKIYRKYIYILNSIKQYNYKQNVISNVIQFQILLSTRAAGCVWHVGTRNRHDNSLEMVARNTQKEIYNFNCEYWIDFICFRKFSIEEELF